MITKYIHSQDSYYKTKNKKSGETSINLSNELREFIDPEIKKTEEKEVTFILYKEDFIKALCYIVGKLPLYKSTSKNSEQINYSDDFLLPKIDVIENFFGKGETANYTVNLFWKADGRVYLNNLKNGDFNLRNFLVEDNSSLQFSKSKKGIILRVVSGEFESSIEDSEEDNHIHNFFRPYITAIKSKPFLLLAGISGTGKSRIVRELARACWDVDSEEYKAHKPKNFEMVQVKPNWHDSSELIGYVSRVSGEAEYIDGPFLQFIAKAWSEPDVPHFLCLDEMNLAPVEQYFAEFLSVVESRKNNDGKIETDPILKGPKEKYEENDTDWYSKLVDHLTSSCCNPSRAHAIKQQFLNEGITIPQNLIVVGTVNMDETTFSFSRKVLDRAMTIEMNKVDLEGGLTNRHDNIGKIEFADIIGKAVEGVDVYAAHKGVCDRAIGYLESINAALDKTPFKVAYRTRNELLLYVVNNLSWKADDESEDFVIARALDEITCMKILTRIEGDETKVSANFLDNLGNAIKSGLVEIDNGLLEGDAYQPISLDKLDEMKERLKSGYTNFWG